MFCRYSYISISNVLWSCVPCTRPELCEIINLKLSRKIYFRAFIYYIILACFLYLLSYLNVYHLYILFVETKKSLIIVVINLIIYIILIIIQTVFIKYPENGVENVESIVNNAIIIVACHCSQDEIGGTVKSLMTAFPPERIFIADNGKTVEPADNTSEVVFNTGLPRENYFYFSTPSKTSALLGVALEVNKTDLDFQYISLIDDDTVIPDDFAINKHHFDDPHVAGVTFGIQVLQRNTLVEACGDWDYKLWCWRNYWRSKWITLKFAVGIFVVWRKECFYKIYTRSPTRQPGGLPFGEDGHAGRICRMLGWKIRQDLHYTVSTYAPPILWPPCFKHGKERTTGYGAVSMWKQRAYRWYRNYPRRILFEMYIFFTYNCKPNPDANYYYIKLLFKNIAYRVDYIYGWFLIFSALNIATTLYVCISDKNYELWFLVHIGLYITGVISGYIMNSIVLRNREDLQVERKILWVYPLFSSWVAMARAFGFIGGILYYIPFKAAKDSFWNNEPRGFWTMRDLPENLSNISLTSLTRFLSGLSPRWSKPIADIESQMNDNSSDEESPSNIDITSLDEYYEYYEYDDESEQYDTFSELGEDYIISV